MKSDYLILSLFPKFCWQSGQLFKVHHNNRILSKMFYRQLFLKITSEKLSLIWTLFKMKEIIHSYKVMGVSTSRENLSISKSMQIFKYQLRPEGEILLFLNCVIWILMCICFYSVSKRQSAIRIAGNKANIFWEVLPPKKAKKKLLFTINFTQTVCKNGMKNNLWN